MANALKQITTKAKKLYKSGKAATWKSAIKKAGELYRKGKKSHSRKRRARVGAVIKGTSRRRKKTYRSGQRVKVHHILAGVGSVAHHKSQLKKSIANAIKHKAGMRELAIKKNQRKKITREIAKLRRDYKAMC